MTATDIGVSAIDYAEHNWPVFPLVGKVPAIAGGRGVLDATTDIDTVTSWWCGRYRDANIGGRVPESMVVIDVDPRHGGLESVAVLEAVHGPLPETLMTISGRGDGGCHYFYRRPPGRLSSRRLGRGIDIKTSTGYVVLAPSVHPATGKPYSMIERPVAAPPMWLRKLLLPVPPPRRSPVRRSPTNTAPTPVGMMFSPRTDGGASMPPIPTLTAPDGCTPPPHRHAQPPSETAACSSTHRTPRSRSPNHQTRRATPGLRRMRSSTTTATCRRLPGLCGGWHK